MPAPELPADVSLNKDTGRGVGLTVLIRLEDGKEMPFGLDTGSAGTYIDKSLEPGLGKRLATTRLSMFDHPARKSGVYHTPKLYLGDVPLMTGAKIYTYDYTGWPIKGLIGMDCLKHYCIQLDFKAEKLRFLDPTRLDAANLGRAYAIAFPQTGRVFIRHGSFTGGDSTNSLMDIAYAHGQRLKGRELPVTYSLVDTGWWNNDGRVNGHPGESLRLAKCLWDGQTYTNLVVGEGENANIIGLQFLARHLVTFNFPDGVMYLKPTSVGPLINVDEESALAFLRQLKQESRMPGWAKGDRGDIHLNEEWDSETFNCLIRKTGDPSLYQCIVSRQSEDEPWTLKKAWRTDPKGHTVEEYQIP